VTDDPHFGVWSHWFYGISEIALPPPCTCYPSPARRGSFFLCRLAEETGRERGREINLTDSSGFVRKHPSRNADV